MPCLSLLAALTHSLPKVQSMVQAALRLPESEPALIKVTQYREQLLSSEPEVEVEG